MRELLASVYTAAIADILDARGYRNQTLPPSIRPLSNGSKVAGPAFTVRGRPAESTDYDAAPRKVLRMLGEVRSGHVAVYACEQEVAAHLGELSVTSLMARGVAGCVLDGGCRDVSFVLEEGFPVFCRFVTPEDSTWRWELEETQVPITIGEARIEPGDWVGRHQLAVDRPDIAVGIDIDERRVDALAAIRWPLDNAEIYGDLPLPGQRGHFVQVAALDADGLLYILGMKRFVKWRVEFSDL